MKGVRQVADATCLACGCLCDDIVLSVAGDQIVKAEKACPIGERWFLADRASDLPACRIDGEPASLQAGYARAADILTAAKYPLFVGLGGLTCEAQRFVVALADRLGGCVGATATTDSPLDTAVRVVGMVTATLGEVRHRTDLVIFWGVDPATTHPRHFERYSLEPRGEFIPNGRADRTCVVIDSRRTATADAADLFLQVKPNAEGTVADILRTLIDGGGELDAATVEMQTGVALDRWRDLAAQMKSARYGAMFFDAASITESMLTLVRDMNRHTRFVCLPMGAAGNEAGAKQLLAWQTGCSMAMDFSSGYPRPWDNVPHFDAALVCACAPSAQLPTPFQLNDLIRHPLVFLHTTDVRPPDTGVAFAVSVAGVHAGGTVFRCDGVPLPLRPAVASPFPTADVVLRAIQKALPMD